MNQYVGVYEGELERVLGGNAVRSSPRPGTTPGGEWDYLLSLPRRTRRRLIGAGYLTPRGLGPDEAADMIADRIPEVDSIDDALEWYVRTALRALDERRRHAHRRRHHRYALSNGASSYYEHRSNVARYEHGHRSLWHHRKERGWT